MAEESSDPRLDLEAVHTIDRMIGDVRSISDADGNATYRDLLALCEKWSAEALAAQPQRARASELCDIPDADLERLTDGRARSRATTVWPIVSGIAAVGCWGAALHSLAVFLAGAACASLFLVAKRRFEAREIYRSGISEGFTHGVFRACGVSRDDMSEYWELQSKREMDRELLRRLDRQHSKKTESQ